MSREVSSVDSQSKENRNFSDGFRTCRERAVKGQEKAVKGSERQWQCKERQLSDDFSTFFFFFLAPRYCVFSASFCLSASLTCIVASQYADTCFMSKHLSKVGRRSLLAVVPTAMPACAVAPRSRSLVRLSASRPPAPGPPRAAFTNSALQHTARSAVTRSQQFF